MFVSAESDINTFALLRDHYVQKHEISTGLFTTSSRTRSVRALYQAAAKTPVHAMRQMDRWRRDGHRTSRYFLCTPVLGSKRRKIREKNDNIDIETRLVSVFFFNLLLFLYSSYFFVPMQTYIFRKCNKNIISRRHVSVVCISHGNVIKYLVSIDVCLCI